MSNISDGTVILWSVNCMECYFYVAVGLRLFCLFVCGEPEARVRRCCRPLQRLNLVTARWVDAMPLRPRSGPSASVAIKKSAVNSCTGGLRRRRRRRRRRRLLQRHQQAAKLKPVAVLPMTKSSKKSLTPNTGDFIHDFHDYFHHLYHSLFVIIIRPIFFLSNLFFAKSSTLDLISNIFHGLEFRKVIEWVWFIQYLKEHLE